MLPIIFGIANSYLNTQEISLLKQYSIWGIILFARNIATKEQTQNLIQEIKKYSKNKNINILIDEEGGRITRLEKIYPKRLKSAKELGDLLENNFSLGTAEIQNTYSIIATRLKELGINIACSPVADLTSEDTHDIIGDRSFSNKNDIVINASKIAADTLLAHNITPIIKHIPGHGRANLDSHLALPYIDINKETLDKTDFEIFRQLHSYPLAMTAHIIYNDIDPDYPVTLSPTMIKYIKEHIGYKGKIMTDDIAMKALVSYGLDEIIIAAFNAGCDYILHCNGIYDEMLEIITVTQNYFSQNLNKKSY